MIIHDSCRIFRGQEIGHVEILAAINRLSTHVCHFCGPCSSIKKIIRDHVRYQGLRFPQPWPWGFGLYPSSSWLPLEPYSFPSITRPGETILPPHSCCSTASPTRSLVALLNRSVSSAHRPKISGPCPPLDLARRRWANRAWRWPRSARAGESACSRLRRCQADVERQRGSLNGSEGRRQC